MLFYLCLYFIFMYLCLCYRVLQLSWNTEGININKIDGSCECKIFYYGFCFITNFSFQPNVKRKEVRIKFILGV